MKLSFKALLLALAIAPLAIACGGADSDDVSDGDDVTEDEAVAARIEPGTWKLYHEPNATPNPSCDMHTKLTLSNDRGSRAKLEEGLDGFCEIAVVPNPREYRLRLEGTSCGSKIYSGSVRKQGKQYKVKITDHRTRVCRDLVPAQIIVEETVPGFPGPITMTQYSLDRAPEGETKTVEGKLAAVMGIGGESTGYAIEAADGLYELVLDEGEKNQFSDGKTAKVTGKLTFLSGVETHNRRALDVSKMLVCPNPGYINCMPGPGRRLSNFCGGEDHDWAVANCPGVQFAH